tara:strand:+ start:255 stop:515 length:261 start_codon:yes stop_codon:yes gene_type:complete
MLEIRVVSASAGMSVTGSITKVLAMGADVDEPILSKVEFGNMTDPPTDFQATSHIDYIQVPAGSYVDGPIGQAEVSGGAFLFYMIK